MTFEERYLKAADRGDFQYSVTEVDDCTGKILSEECIYKEKSVGNIKYILDEYEIEIDGLQYDPYCIIAYRHSRKSAREFLERIIKNDESNNGKNVKYL